MRVAILTSAYPPAVGGAETYARRLAEGLLARSHQVRVFTDGSRGAPADGPTGPEVTRLTKWLPRIGDPSLVPWEEAVFGVLPELDALLRPGEWDVLHANSFETALIARVLAGRDGTPVVATYHEMLPLTDALGVSRSRFAYAHGLFDRLIAGSHHYLQRAYQAGAPRDAVRLVPHGVPAPPAGTHRDAARRRLGHADDDLLVVLPGRFKERKGQLDFLTAFQLVHKALPQARALLVGSVHSGSHTYLTRMRERVEEAGLTSVAQVRTDVSLDGMPDVYAAADLVVVPSHAEGLGLVVLEAMAAGLPVVGTQVSGIAEIIHHGENGLLSPPGEPASLARQILTVLGDRDLARRLAAAGMRTQRGRYALDQMIDGTEAVYREVGPRATDTPDRVRPVAAVRRTVSSRVIHQTRWIRVRQDVVIEPDGETAEFTVVSRGDFVVILPVTDAGDVVLVRQHRYASGTWQLELPQGSVEDGETPAKAGLRELREETGYDGLVTQEIPHPFYEAADWADQHFTIVHVSVGRRGTPRPEPGEQSLETVVLPYPDVVRAVQEGTITDPPTLAALYHAHLSGKLTGGDKQ